MIKVTTNNEDVATSLAKEVLYGWAEARHKSEMRLYNFNTAKAKQLLDKDYCRWQNYLKLFNFAKRSKLEQAMLIYELHCRFIEISLDTTVQYLLSKPLWKNKYFPEFLSVLN